MDSDGVENSPDANTEVPVRVPRHRRVDQNRDRPGSTTDSVERMVSGAGRTRVNGRVIVDGAPSAGGDDKVVAPAGVHSEGSIAESAVCHHDGADLGVTTYARVVA